MKLTYKNYKIEITKNAKGFFYCSIYNSSGRLVIRYAIFPEETVYSVRRNIVDVIDIYEFGTKEANKKWF